MTTYIEMALFVKSYVLEVDSPETVRLLEEMGEPFAYSHPHELEIPNAIRLKRFRGEITVAQETAAIRAFFTDVDAGRFQRIHCDLGNLFISSGKAFREALRRDRLSQPRPLARRRRP